MLIFFCLITFVTCKQCVTSGDTSRYVMLVDFESHPHAWSGECKMMDDLRCCPVTQMINITMTADNLVGERYLSYFAIGMGGERRARKYPTDQLIPVHDGERCIDYSTSGAGPYPGCQVNQVRVDVLPPSTICYEIIVTEYYCI